MNEWSGKTKFCIFFFSDFNSGVHRPLNTGRTTFVPNLGLLWVVRFMSCFLASLVLPRYWLYDRVHGNFHILEVYTVISSWIISAFAPPKLLFIFSSKSSHSASVFQLISISQGWGKVERKKRIFKNLSISRVFRNRVNNGNLIYSIWVFQKQCNWKLSL